jgi:hypothetical protein
LWLSSLASSCARATARRALSVNRSNMLCAALPTVMPAMPDANTIGRVGEDQRSCVLRNLRDLPHSSLNRRLDRPDESGLPVTIWSRMTAEAAKAPHQIAGRWRYASGTASRAAVTAGQRVQVKVPG